MRQIIFLNKKGNIPVIVLTIGVFVICSLAVITFVNSSFSFGNSFTVITSVEKVNSYVREAQFYLINGEKPEEIMDIFLGNVSEGDFIYRGERKKDGEYVIKVSLLKKKSFFDREKVEIFYFDRSFFE